MCSVKKVIFVPDAFGIHDNSCQRRCRLLKFRRRHSMFSGAGSIATTVLAPASNDFRYENADVRAAIENHISRTNEMLARCHKFSAPARRG